MDHDHLPALTALLYAAPALMLALAGLEVSAGRGWPPAAALRTRIEMAPGEARVAALLMVLAGAVHLGLVPGHLGDPVYVASFAASGLALPLLALAYVADARWRPHAALVLAGVIFAYGLTRVAGLEGIDALGVATAAVELAALGLILNSGVAKGYCPEDGGQRPEAAPEAGDARPFRQPAARPPRGHRGSA